MTEMTSTEITKQSKSIVVAVPCFNEAVTIQKVVRDFQAALPEAAIHVFDNNSADQSAKLAEEAGAVVHRVRKQGKGHVLQAMFDHLDADALVLVDGDDTYSAQDVHRLLDPVLRGEADMIVGNRLETATDEDMRRHRQFGNRLIVTCINLMFGTKYQDVLSGYRAFNRRFIETVPLLTSGFEIETEMTLQALEERLEIVEIPISYSSRPQESHSKLNAFRDGYRILLTAAMLLRDHHPLRLFGGAGLALLLVGFSLLFWITPWRVSVLSGNDIILLAGVLLLVALSVMSFGMGLILNAINTRFHQLKQIMERNKNFYD